jgi:hypothetical protein
MLHVTLEVEVGELITRLEVKKLGEGSIRVDLATIGLVLKTLGTDVAVDLLGDLSASHLGASGLAKELGKLITDASGLDEAGRLAVAGSLLLLGRGLLGVLELTTNNLLEGLEIALHAGEDARKLLELGIELAELGGDRALARLSSRSLNGRSRSRSRSCRGSLYGGSRLLSTGL